MGTQYVEVEGESSNRQLKDYDLTELVCMQSRAIQHSRPGYFYLFCQVESKDAITKFLNDGLPLESKLLETGHLNSWCQSQRKKGKLTGKQDIVDALSFTYLARRISTNPTYYDSGNTSLDIQLSHIADQLSLEV
jgi:antiviral helicase SLH1